MQHWIETVNKHHKAKTIFYNSLKCALQSVEV